MAIFLNFMLNVNLLVGITREGETQVSDDPFLEVRLEFLSIEILLSSVSRSEIVNERTDFFSLSFLPGSLLDEGSERSSSGTETSHDYRLSIERRELDEEVNEKLENADIEQFAERSLTFITEGFTEAITLSPGLRPARYRVH